MNASPLGFDTALVADVDLKLWTNALNQAATDRGIKLNAPSDALDASLEIILLEAATAANAQYEIVDNTIRLWRTDLNIDWETIE